MALRASREAGEDCVGAHEMGALNEQWVHSYVGFGINRYLASSYKGDFDRPFVTYELSVNWLDYFLDRRRPGPLPTGLSEKSRFDICVWSKGFKPVGLVEIKDEPIMQEYSRGRDPEKISSALRKFPSLKWGIFLFSVRVSDERRHDQISHIDEKIRLVCETSDEWSGYTRSRLIKGPFDKLSGQKVRWAALVYRAASH